MKPQIAGLLCHKSNVCISTGDKGEKSDNGGSNDGKIQHLCDVVL